MRRGQPDGYRRVVGLDRPVPPIGPGEIQAIATRGAPGGARAANGFQDPHDTPPPFALVRLANVEDQGVAETRRKEGLTSGGQIIQLRGSVVIGPSHRLTPLWRTSSI